MTVKLSLPDTRTPYGLKTEAQKAAYWRERCREAKRINRECAGLLEKDRKRKLIAARRRRRMAGKGGAA